MEKIDQHLRKAGFKLVGPGMIGTNYRHITKAITASVSYNGKLEMLVVDHLTKRTIDSFYCSDEDQVQDFLNKVI